jgi:hypothetical protein
MEKRKFRVGDRVIIRNTQREGVIANFWGGNYDVEFHTAGCTHCWNITEEELDQVENALQRLKRKYAKAKI